MCEGSMVSYRMAAKRVELTERKGASSTRVEREGEGGVGSIMVR